jgi:hypothetical protein
VVTGKSADEYSFLGLTGKVKVSNTLLTVGTHEPVMPVLYRNDTRLLPQTYEGVQIVSKDIPNLTLTGGQFTAAHQRDSTNYEDLTMFSDGATGGVTTDQFNYAGISYAFTPQLTGMAYRSELKDNYSQNVASVIATLPLTAGIKLKSDVRYFDSNGEGKSTVDNRYLGAMFTLKSKGHSLGIGYQNQDGRTGLPFLLVADPWALNNGTYFHFVRASEDSWQLRYDYDFAASGVPGLTLMTRYMRGDDFKISGASAKEWERDIDLGYVIQSGPLSGVGLLWRNVTYRGSSTTDIDENRALISYTFKFW